MKIENIDVGDEYYGLKITKAWFDKYENKLYIEFDSGKVIVIQDRARHCCEHRYMTTDDNPNDLVGYTLIRIEEKKGPEIATGWGKPHDQVFVEIATDKSFITIVNHNEHNGYYDGFELHITEEGDYENEDGS